MSNPAGKALEMSDEDFLKLDPSTFEGTGGEATDPDDLDDNNQPNPDEDGGPDKEAPADSSQDQPDESEDDKTKDPPLGGGASVVDPEKKDIDSQNSKDSEESPKSKPAPDELTEAQYVAIGKQIMAEFKANGTTLKMKSVEDAIQLMQMGANYHQKMKGLKPSLKTLKLLENNGLLDPEKLNYLIDLSQKKPEAITKLLKDSKIDPLDLDLVAESSYTPAKRTVNDTELVLDEVLDSIKDTSSYDRTLTVLGTEWDDTSRATIAKDPEVIRTINLHMENGIFDQVVKAIAYERSLGKLTGISDLDAYQRVGTYMNENGLFKSSAVPPPPVVPRSPESSPQARESDAQAEERRRKQKQAASPSRQRQTPAKDDANYNPLAMSDEDFIKFNKLSL